MVGLVDLERNGRSLWVASHPCAVSTTHATTGEGKRRGARSAAVGTRRDR